MTLFSVCVPIENFGRLLAGKVPTMGLLYKVE